MKKLLFAFLFIASFSAKAQLPSYVPTSNLVTYYAFDKINGANDLSGNGNHGTVYGNVILDVDKCEIDSNSLIFNTLIPGIVRTVVDTTTFHNFNGGLTISLWGYVPDLSPEDTVIRTLIQYGNFKVTANIENLWGAIPKNYITYTDGYDSVYVYASDHTPGTNWFNYTVTISDSVRVYIDGDLVAIEPTLAPMSTLNTFTDGNLYVGGYLTNVDTSALFYGNIDNVAIYNRAITLSEVHDLHYACPTLNTYSINGNQDRIYPSPANNIVTININTNRLFYIVDSTGRSVRTCHSGDVIISDLPNGSYLITDRDAINKRIVINH